MKRLHCIFFRSWLASSMRWRFRFTILPLAPALLLASCASFSKKKEEKPARPAIGPGAVPIQLRAGHGQDGTPIKPGGNVSGVTANNVTESDVVWTDPDDANVGIPELETLLKAARDKGGPWMDSPSDALKLAKLQSKPIIIWFTDSMRSPYCKTLSRELFARDDFEAWASNNTIRIKVDQNVKAETMDQTVRRQEYVAELKQRYKAKGYPTLVVLTPGGDLIGRYTGYSAGKADYTWGLLKQACSVADKRYTEWRKSLEEKGYRQWSNDTGITLFAKLVSYYNGELVLVEPDGQYFKTKESHLSAADRDWIRQQKQMRGIN
jgi:Thioredoxin-like domain